MDMTSTGDAAQKQTEAEPMVILPRCINLSSISELSVKTYTMPAAEFARENPLAPLRAYEPASAAGATAPEGDYPDRGHEASILPYRLQDQYGRTRQPRAFRTAVLENEFLRA